MRIIYIILDINPADFLFTFFPLEPNVVGARSKSFDLFDLQLANWSKKTTADFKHLQYLVKKTTSTAFKILLRNKTLLPN